MAGRFMQVEDFSFSDGRDQTSIAKATVPKGAMN
jgi:hypothetical protein